jgi:stress-induced-phosphoprotein 1
LFNINVIISFKWYSIAIENDPRNHMLYSNRSAAYLLKKQWRQAAKDAEQSTKLNPS